MDTVGIHDDWTAEKRQVKVLLATCNGAAWLDSQLSSIYEQKFVQISVVASDDASDDDTRECLEQWSTRLPIGILPSLPQRLGSANRNFLRLIREAPLTDADFVALADQDDVWFPMKLARAVEKLIRSDADAYSSNVTAYWPSGRRVQLVKSQPQRQFDHIFESAGPGCTFVFKRSAFDRLRAWVSNNFEKLQRIKVHDWLIYAYGRTSGWAWHIDKESLMLYRQHGKNEIGANSGWRAALRRWQHIRHGRFRYDVLEIAGAVGIASPVVGALTRFSLSDRLWLALHARECRRRFRDSMLLGACFLIMKRNI